MMRPNYINQIESRILSSKEGAVFVTADFTDISDKKTISVDLARLQEKNIIQRVLRGVYYKVEYSTFLKEYVAPDVVEVAKAIARNNGWTIVPCGDSALNALGLTTQVPAIYLYACDGAYKEYSCDGIIIRFCKTTNKNITNLSPKTALVIQALKALGKKRVDKTVVNRLDKLFSKEDKEIMFKEAKNSTSWIYKIIKQIYRESNETNS